MASFLEPSNNNKFESSVLGISKNEDFISSFCNDICNAYAVFDGHGGHYVSRDMAKGTEQFPSFCQFICTKFLEYDNSISVEDYIKKLFLEYDIILKNYHSGVIGSTATLCLTFQNHIYLAYVGDSSAMIIKDQNLIYQTLNHNSYEDSEEKSRLERANVKIIPASDFCVVDDDTIKVTQGSYHEFTFHYLKDQLAMTRAFGHYSVKAYNRDTDQEDFSSNSSLIVKPTVFKIPIESNLEIIIGSDGVWDVINPESKLDEINSIINKAKENGENVSEAITKFAEFRWKKDWSVINKDLTKFKITMTDPIQWDDIACVYLKF